MVGSAERTRSGIDTGAVNRLRSKNNARKSRGLKRDVLRARADEFIAAQWEGWWVV